MNTSVLVWINVVLVTLCAQANARLLETEREIQGRYGNPFSSYKNDPPGSVMRAYKHQDFYIFVWFVGGKSQCENYFKQDRRSQLLGSEVDLFLIENSFNGKWEKTSQPNMVALAKPAAFAFYDSENEPPFLQIFTAEWKKRTEKEN